MAGGVEVVAIPGLPEVGEGDRVGELVASATRLAGIEIVRADIVVISQKVVSKAEGRVRELGSVQVGDRALELAAELRKDPRLVQLVLDESDAVVRAERGVLITRTHGGLICANAGIDASNVPGMDHVALLPLDADASARRIRAELRDAAGAAPAVIVADSFGRPWRLGQGEVAIGCAGIEPLDDWRGRPDRDGRELSATVVALADQVAAAADLVRGKDEGLPVTLVRGLGRHVRAADGPGAAALRRPAADDLFR